MMAKLSSAHGPFALKALIPVNDTIFHDFVTKKEFQDKDILSLCLNVFNQDDTWSADDEELLEEAIDFFDICHDKKLLVKGSDYVKLLPLCVKGLKKFSTNARIRECALYLIDGACSSNSNKRNVEKTGAIKALATLLILDGVEDFEKISCASSSARSWHHKRHRLSERGASNKRTNDDLFVFRQLILFKFLIRPIFEFISRIYILYTFGGTNGNL